MTSQMMPSLQSTSFPLKHAFAVRACAMAISACILAGCGGAGTGKPVINDISVQGTLYFGGQATFLVDGFFSAGQGVTLDIPNCQNQSLLYSGTTNAVIACDLRTSGTLPVQARNQAGEVIFSKTFTVPQPQVLLHTNKGDIVAELNPQAAPATVLNFLHYVKTGFYKNTIFHRVVPGFVIQGGGFAPGLTPQANLLAPIALESNNGLPNARGTLAMARTSDPNSATSQFYFNLADNPVLDYQSASNPGYAVFGKIVQGLDVMDAIGTVATTSTDGHSDVPVADVLLNTALQIQ